MSSLRCSIGPLPSFNRNPLEITAEAEREGIDVRDYVVRELKEGRLRFAAEDPDAPENFPRVLTLWRCNLLGSSSKGHEFFLKHLLGVPDAAVRADESPEEMRSGNGDDGRVAPWDTAETALPEAAQPTARFNVDAINAELERLS